MNRREKTSGFGSRRSQLSRQVLLQYFLALVGYFCALVLAVFLAWQFCSGFNWRPDDPVYLVLGFIRDYIILFVGLFALAGWTLITYYFISKPLRYLDEVVAAARQLVVAAQEPVELPAALLDTQNELNLVREKALNDAHAAREAEQRKNDLVVYLAHDLKTPLTSVIGYLTLLRDEPELPQEARAKYTGIALEKAERLEVLINEFFDITRFNLTHLELECRTVDLRRMLEQITFEFQPILEEKGLRWELCLVSGAEIWCDPDKLERVFDNLFRNAVNYSDAGTEIRVALHTQECSAVVQVQNHGRTIPPEKLGRIFEQFYRADASRATATGGAGLGLAIAKEIVLLHGGSICAESADEHILFTVTLPLKSQKIV